MISEINHSAIIKQFRRFSNQQLVDRINYLFENEKNDDDEIYELCRRREEQGFKTKVIGNKIYIN
jgi:uncharacterized protein (UPF0335 family)